MRGQSGLRRLRPLSPRHPFVVLEAAEAEAGAGEGVMHGAVMLGIQHQKMLPSLLLCLSPSFALTAQTDADVLP